MVDHCTNKATFGGSNYHVLALLCKASSGDREQQERKQDCHPQHGLTVSNILDNISGSLVSAPAAILYNPVLLLPASCELALFASTIAQHLQCVSLQHVFLLCHPRQKGFNCSNSLSCLAARGAGACAVSKGSNATPSKCDTKKGHRACTLSQSLSQNAVFYMFSIF